MQLMLIIIMADLITDIIIMILKVTTLGMV